MKDWAVSFLAAACLVSFIVFCTREVIFLVRGVV